MLSVPFPVITLLALLFLLTVALFSGQPRHKGMLRFLIACILLLSVSTLRWEYDLVALRNIQSVLAILLPPLAWHSFISLTEYKKKQHLLLLLVPVVITLAARILWPAATDFLLFLLFGGYGIALIRTAWRGDDAFTLSRLSAASHTTWMAFFAGGFLCLSALTDIVITYDFSMTGGKLAPAIVVFFQVALLPFIGAAIISAGRTVTASDVHTSAGTPPQEAALTG